MDKSVPVGGKEDLIAYLAAGGKPRENWLIGTEHEKFGFDVKTLKPLAYDGVPGIRAMLEGLRRFGWEPVYEGENVIALTQDGASISLEPGGQLELSGAPLKNVHQTCDEVNAHLEQVRTVAEEIGAAFLGLGFQPKWRLEETPVMPKGRYRIMRAYMPTRGGKGLDMMFRSCTVQVNLDFADEADMVRKFRTSLALQPVATALFANSPFVDGRPAGALSYRSLVWEDTDPDRCGMLPFVFEDGFGFERYVDYALDVPMYFVYRDGRYIDASGQSFRDFLAGELPALPGEKPTLKDWDDHLTTLFPEVRMKQFLEMRGADSGPWRRLCALPAFWVGLLYDDQALDEAWDLVRHWSLEDRLRLRREVPLQALNTPAPDGGSLRDLARRVLEISLGGLRRRRQVGGCGNDEGLFLEALRTIVDTGKTPAEHLLELYHGRWGGSVDPVFREFAY